MHMFGKRVYEMLKGHLVWMAEASSEEIRNEVLVMAEALLKAKPCCNGQGENNFTLSASHRQISLHFLHATSSW